LMKGKGGGVKGKENEMLGELILSHTFIPIFGKERREKKEKNCKVHLESNLTAEKERVGGGKKRGRRESKIVTTTFLMRSNCRKGGKKKKKKKREKAQAISR